MSSLPGAPTFHLRLHTGPVKGEQRSVTRQLKRAKVHIVMLGTEHVYISMKATSCEDAQMRLAKALQQKGLRRLAMQAFRTTCARKRKR